MSEFEKGDRIVRLLGELRQFQAVPHGLSTRQLAERMGISQRQAQRDLKALEEYLGVPFTTVDNRWVVDRRFWLAPLSFSLAEAMGLLLSSRLMLRHAEHADEFTASAYEKLAAILPEPIRDSLAEAARGLARKPADGRYTKILTDLVAGWAERRKVRITYTTERTFERTVWPLFLEPSPLGHGIYLLAWDQKLEAVRSYRVERMTETRLLAETFQPPMGFDAGRHLGQAWGIWSPGEPVEVELLFAPAVAKRAQETTWHPSQSLHQLPDGRVRMTLTVSSWLELRHWVLGWGETVEVVKPAELRNSVRAAVASLARVYGIGQPPAPRPGRQQASDAVRTPRPR
ncbi:MAG TPA: WYL domain-containing transcriptional regulator [Candidatus Dormibacteraeota bacterium]|nr:WYL domain-containing transcriptional regulator [Candidatus Dormibacteraeota bacterium]